MAVVIRLQRGGSKKRPAYSVVVADSRRPVSGKFLEKIGEYRPMLKVDDSNRFVINNIESLKKWLSCGASLSERVAYLIKFKSDIDVDVTRFLAYSSPKSVKEQEDMKAKALEEKKKLAAEKSAEENTDEEKIEEAKSAEDKSVE